EDYAAFKRRIGAHVAQLAQPGGAAPPTSAGQPDMSLTAERSEAGNLVRRQALMASETDKDAELARRSEAVKAAKESYADSAWIAAETWGLMRRRGQRVFSPDELRRLPAAEKQ